MLGEAPFEKLDALFACAQVLVELRMEARVFFSESLEGRLGTRQRSTTLSKPHGPACQAGAQGQDQGDEEGPIDVRSHSVGLICPVNGEEEELVSRSTCGLTSAWSRRGV